MHQKNINIYDLNHSNVYGLNGGWQQQCQSQTQKAAEMFIEIEEKRTVQ